jgi:hypothetical protein
MRTTCTAHRAETGQSIGEHSAARGQMCFGPLADCDQVETRDRSEFDAQGWPSSLREAAATNGTLFSEPRPTLPPVRSPPK